MRPPSEGTPRARALLFAAGLCALLAAVLAWYARTAWRAPPSPELYAICAYENEGPPHETLVCASRCASLGDPVPRSACERECDEEALRRGVLVRERTAACAEQRAPRGAAVAGGLGALLAGVCGAGALFAARRARRVAPA